MIVILIDHQGNREMIKEVPIETTQDIITVMHSLHLQVKKKIYHVLFAIHKPENNVTIVLICPVY